MTPAVATLTAALTAALLLLAAAMWLHRRAERRRIARIRATDPWRAYLAARIAERVDRHAAGWDVLYTERTPS